MMKKFLPVLISVALLICAVAMPPLRLFRGNGLGNLNDTGGANGSEIVNVEDFAVLLSCMKTRSKQTIMSMQGDGENYVLSASDAVGSVGTEETVNSNMENQMYTSWKTVFDASASMYYGDYSMDVEGTLEIIVDGDESFYKFKDVSVNVKGDSVVRVSYDAQAYFGNGVAITQYNDVSIDGMAEVRFEEEFLDKWIDISTMGEAGDLMTEWGTTQMFEFFDLLEESIRDAMEDGSFHGNSNVYYTVVEDVDLTVDLRSPQKPSAKLVYMDDDVDFNYSIEFSGINSTNLGFDLSEITIYDANDFAKEEYK